MESPITPPVAPQSETVESPSLSVLQRLGRVFARPMDAWVGLDHQVQFWFPMLITLVLSAASVAIVHHRALVPMITERLDQAVQDGKMTAEQVDKMRGFFESPAGMALTVGQQVIILALIMLLVALLIWFGTGFVLGTKMRYRLALEVAAWASLINVPAIALTTWLAWNKETMKGIHTGFGILLPDSDTPSKLMTGLGTFLDGIGPFAIWYLVVIILGATALSQAKRGSVAWVIVGLYAALLVFFSAMAAVFTPGA